jgi:EmrB/QacA subfamily drug resistance transporter
MTEDHTPVTSPAAALTATAPSRTGPNPWRTLAVVLVGAFMALLDVTVVNVALPSIATGLGAGETVLEWVVAGYALAFGLVLIPAGRLGDRFGHRTTFACGLAVFTLASLACGLAQSPLQLVAARIVQGIGAGLFQPAIPATIQTNFTGRDRSRAFGMLGATIGLSTALGPLLGGALVELGGPDHGWRWIFLVNVPIGLVIVPLALRLLPRPARTVPRGVDPVGLLLLSAGLVALLLPLIEGQRLDWPAWTWASFAASAVLLGGLWAWEVRLAGRGGEPLIPVDLVRRLPFAAGCLLALVYFASFTSLFFTISLLWQTGLGRSPLAAGLVVIPFALANMVVAGLSDRFSARLGRRVLILGCALMSTGLSLVLVVLHLQAPAPSAWALAGPLALAGIGNGLFIAPNQDFVLATVERQEAGAASGFLSTAQRIGSSIGIAAVGTVLFGTLDARGPADLARAFTHSAQLATVLNVGLVLLALVLVLALPKKARAGG